MKYDENYYYGLLRMQTEHAQKIAEIRWEFVRECNVRFVLDYGCGVGFFKAFAPSGIQVDTYDIGPYVMTGISRRSYDLICLWDVIEHIPHINDRLKDLFDNSKFMALAIPMLPKGKDLLKWKHFKPGEHLHYFDDKTLDILFLSYGFRRIKSEYPECPPREDVESVLYRSGT